MELKCCLFDNKGRHCVHGKTTLTKQSVFPVRGTAHKALLVQQDNLHQGIIMKSTLLIAPILAFTFATATAAEVSSTETIATQAPVAIEYVAATPVAPVIVTADALETFYQVIDFGYKYLPDPPILRFYNDFFG
jgi:hypothetical protein